ncbi:hypothetical protein D349_02731 [Enterococcus faecalis UP2S-6]|nr:hypothetical protein D349_02731 [Enterococcus faecalis UP2S-6]
MAKNEEFMMELHDFKQICDYERQSANYEKKWLEIEKQIGALSLEIHEKEVQRRFLEEYRNHIESLQITSSKYAQAIRDKTLDEKS